MKQGLFIFPLRNFIGFHRLAIPIRRPGIFVFFVLKLYSPKFDDVVLNGVLSLGIIV